MIKHYRLKLPVHKVAPISFVSQHNWPHSPFKSQVNPIAFCCCQIPNCNRERNIPLTTIFRVKVLHAAQGTPARRQLVLISKCSKIVLRLTVYYICFSLKKWTWTRLNLSPWDTPRSTCVCGNQCLKSSLVFQSQQQDQVQAFLRFHIPRLPGTRVPKLLLSCTWHPRRRGVQPSLCCSRQQRWWTCPVWVETSMTKLPIWRVFHGKHVDFTMKNM